jgi:hypothetical protein
LAAALWAAFRRAPRAALTRERLAAVDALERLSGLVLVRLILRMDTKKPLSVSSLRARLAKHEEN